MGVLVMKFFLLHSLFHAWLILFCSSLHLNHGNETDRLALLAIKAHIRHDPNRIMTSWNESRHFCLWHGVTCSRRHHQRVTKLDLLALELVGSIPPHIGNLSFLRALYLEQNSFSHQIPPQIGSLHRLEVITLYNNSLDGTIPANISNCFKLDILNLARNNLVGQIPTKLSSLSKLRIFSLQQNHLTGEIPPSLGNLSSLEEIFASENNLQGSIPSSLCEWKKLTGFYLGPNTLSGTIPSCIYNLSGIVEFAVEGNQIQGSIPSDLFDAFPNLQVFSIADNKFTGGIPRSISNATSLVAFQVNMNNLTGQVPNLGKLYNLIYLLISVNNLGRDKHGDLNFVLELTNATQLSMLLFHTNNFGGTLPTSISNLSTNLEYLWVAGNNIHGSIPNGLGNLFNLQLLGLRGNSFAGTIPTDIGKLSRLGELDLRINQLSGSIPPSLGNLTMLTGLYLQRNNLNGSIPLSLGKCRGLLELDLSQNNLDGTIPKQLLVGLPSFSISLNLSKNHFIGSLPMEIGKLKNVGALDISDNMLSGKLPSSLGSCESLEVLQLQGNFFRGLIPSSLKELKGIRDLDLSRNNLSGDIPPFLEGYKFLENLNLSFNDFWGEVPIEGVFNNLSATSIVGNTKLCGGIANLRLPACNSKDSKGGRLSSRMKLMISLISSFTLLGNVVVLCFLLLRKKRKETESKTLGNSVLQVSYATLLKATDGFSSANLIGVGAFGSVFKGILAEDNLTVAVKVLNMLHRGASKSFIAECAALRNIRHRNLVKILTACSSIDFKGNDFKALVYEFMENWSLEEWLHPSTRIEQVREASKTLSLVKRLNIAINVACALDYLHNHCEPPIVHCDLKPSNVLLDKELTGHVSDFGLASILSTVTHNVSGNQSSSIGIRGSVGYAAPEYGMGSEVSTKGDVYSFGILLLELFTGKRPTDHMFSDGSNLHNYVKDVLPDHVTKITDSLLLQGGITEIDEALNQGGARAMKVEECLTLIFGIGITCSAEYPINRKNMSDVVSELYSIRKNLLG